MNKNQIKYWATDETQPVFTVLVTGKEIKNSLGKKRAHTSENDHEAEEENTNNKKTKKKKKRNYF